MYQRSQSPVINSKRERSRPYAVCRSLFLQLRRASTCWLLLVVVIFSVVAGCDLFDPGKTNEPIFGPPPPRVATATGKSAIDIATADPPATDAAGSKSTASSENATGPTASAQAPEKGHGGPDSPAADFGVVPATARGSAPADGDIKTMSFTGHAPAATSRMSGNEVVATVNGQPIFASEIFERAFPEPLPPEGISLLAASKNISNGRVSEQDYRALQETAIKKYLKDYIRTRVLAQAIEATMEKDQKEKIEEAIGKMFDEYVERLKKDLKAAARHEVDKKLHESGTSLASLKVEFRYRLLADEYVRQKSRKPHIVGRQEVLAYYEEHVNDYSYPEKVHWQLLEVSFAKHGTPEKALVELEKAVDALRRGEDFGKVAKKYSDGPRAENGGQQSWTKPDSVADTKTADLLRSLAPGEISPVVHTATGYRLIRMTARKPAGRGALAEVQDSIKQKIEEKLQQEATREVLVAAYKDAAIDSSFLRPEELGPPADIAGVPTPAKNGGKNSKNRRERP